MGGLESVPGFAQPDVYVEAALVDEVEQDAEVGAGEVLVPVGEVGLKARASCPPAKSKRSIGVGSPDELPNMTTVPPTARRASMESETSVAPAYGGESISSGVGVTCSSTAHRR